MTLQPNVSCPARPSVGTAEVIECIGSRRRWRATTNSERRMTVAEMTRDRLASLTDEDLLAYERQQHGDPYMTLARAKEMRRVALRFWHLRHR
jgi:hypothetical protein